MNSRDRNVNGHPDDYRRRLGLAVLGVAILGIVAALLGPKANPEGEWYAHTGVEGDLVLMESIEIVSDLDPATLREARSMPGATQGVHSPITEDIVNEDNPDLRTKTNPFGRPDPQFSVLRQVEPELRAKLQQDDQVEMNRATQSSADFVLLHATSPRYPDGIAPAIREREVIVHVNIYVGEDGRVHDAYVDRNNGGPFFEAAVLVAVKQWIYRPYTQDGEATGFWDNIYFTFRFNSGTRASELSIPTRG